MKAINPFVHNRIRLQGAFAAGVTAVLLISLESWHILSPILENLLSLAGWVLVGLGVLGRVWSGSYICGYKNERLMMDGPYSVCRNPLYFYSFLAGLGVMFITETLILPLLFIVVFWGCYPSTMRREEETLHQRHGLAFEAYCAAVPRFWPDFSLYSEPVSYSVSAAHFRRHLLQALWFVVAGGIVEFIEDMHETGHLPVLMHLY